MALPASLSFCGFGNNEITTIFNNRALKFPLIVQVIDGSGRSCREPNLKVELVIADELRFCPALEAEWTDENGQVNYGKPTVSTRSLMLRGCPVNMCGKRCLGILKITVKGSYREKTLTESTLQFHIQIPPNGPHKLNVQCNDTGIYAAGSELKEYNVSVLDVDDVVIHVSAAKMSMKLWQEGKSKCTALAFPPSAAEINPTPGVFSFRKLLVPRIVGHYWMQFVYMDGNVIINSDTSIITVLPGKPEKLVPSCPLNTITVSNDKDRKSRLLVENLDLELRDAFDNKAGEEINGQMLVQVMCNDPVELPFLTGNVTSKHFRVVKGNVKLNNIMIEHNSPGVHGKSYFLRCQIKSDDLYVNCSIPELDIPFLYNDSEKQQLVSGLVKEKDDLEVRVQAYRELFETSRQLLLALEDSVKELTEEVLKSKLELLKYGIDSNAVDNPSSTKAVLQKKISEKVDISTAHKKRKNATENPLVIGKVWQLAVVSDEDVSRILSWHLQDSMECVITQTMQKAIDINNDTRGKQQVLALDSLQGKTERNDILKEPLPHTKVVGHYEPNGNPMYARELLIFTKDLAICEKVFDALLGDTIIIDTWEDGISYREKVLDHTHCPTILTRDGRRIKSNGQFGGVENSAPSRGQMKNQVFRLAREDAAVSNCVIELLQNHCSLLERHEQVKDELVAYTNESSSSATTKRTQEYTDMLNRLKQVNLEIDLAMTTTTTAVTSCSPRVTSPPVKHEHSNGHIASKIFEPITKLDMPLIIKRIKLQ